MAVPSVSTPLSMTSGRTGGRYLLVVTGTDFQLPPAPSEPNGLPVPKPAATVRAWFVSSTGALTEAERVDVVSATQLHILVPSHDPGIVDLRVANVDANGDTIPGEVTDAPAAFEFKRPMLSGEQRTEERILARVVRAFRRLLVREVLENVAITVHTDFDATPEDALHTVEVAKLPSLLMVGPNLSNNRFYSSNVKRTVALGGGGFAELRPSRTVDLGFTLLGLSEFKQELLNFTQEVEAFFQRNPYLYVQRDPADPSLGSVRYELALTSDPQTAGAPNDSNVRQFSAECVIRGVDLDDESMFVRRTAALEEVVLNPEEAIPGTGAGGDVLVGDGTTGPLPWPITLDPKFYQIGPNGEAISESDNILTDEDGNELTDEDGNPLGW